MKKLLVLLIPFLLFASYIKIENWNKNETLYSFFKRHNIPFSLYYTLDKQTRNDLKYIPSWANVYMVYEGSTLKRLLIPFNTKHQLRIDYTHHKYSARVVPLKYTTQKKFAKITIKNFLSYDVYQATKEEMLTSKLVNIFQDRVNFRLLPANTVVEIYYTKKLQFQKPIDLEITYARIKNRHYDIQAYKYTDGRYYDQHGKSLKGMFLAYPMKYKYISSGFGRRFHPILHKWRMHDGIDYVNKIGTPIKAVADGRVIYKGWIRGYGKTVKIQHKYGYMTLYGHMRGFGHIRVGSYIKQGTIIGYMGNTGLSTGPHLHFGVLYKNRWINPSRLRKSVKIVLRGYKRKKFFAFIRNIKRKVDLKVAMR
ncbi:MAG: M23 family metallopeptidase [Epsilonproteobacteria bacterium]|nr:M23 family metallopeptidase [Campylobacterota bacterium]